MRTKTTTNSGKREITDLLARNARVGPGQKRLNIKDAIVQGFTLRVTASGAKTFALMMRDSTGRNRTCTIGIYPELSVKEARRMAEKIRHGVRYDGIIDARPSGEEARSGLTFRELLDEVELVFARTKGAGGGAASKGNMRAATEAIFEGLLDRPVESLTEHDLADCASGYKPRRPLKGKTTANGQVSRALSYLSPVFDWAAIAASSRRSEQAASVA